jgi:transposase
MKQCFIVGVDVSKSTLDVYFKPSKTFQQITNTAAGFRSFYRSLQVQGHAQNILVVMEHTGHYSRRFEEFLRAKDIGYCKIPALQIKRSLGVTRGKNDKIDAERIAEYGWLRKDLLKQDEVLQPKLQQLQALLSLRKKLVADRAGYIGRLKEMKHTGICNPGDIEARCHHRIIKCFTTEILKAEAAIKMLISSDEALQRTNKLLQSIRGIGWIVAASMICYTNNFTKFSTARKFNCYAGIAPFAHESGSSIRRRSRISHLANKEAKTLLNLAAFSAIRNDQELKQYYQRRVAEGKRKMSCINIVRAKLVSRMFAVIKRQTPFEAHPLAA